MTVTSIGTLEGDQVDVEIHAVATGVDVNEYDLDCCTGLHIRMKGTVGAEGEIVFDDYCDKPKSFCDGCMCDDWGMEYGDILMIFECAASYSSVEEQLAACWDRANGIDP